MAEITKQAGISSLSEIKDNPQNYKRFIKGFGSDLSKSFSSLIVKYKEIFTDEGRVDIFKIEKNGKPFGQIEFHGLLRVEIRVEEGKNLANLKDTVKRIIEKREEKMKKNGLIPDIRR